MEVIEQLTYLLFIRRLDEAQSLKESEASLLKVPVKDSMFPAGKDPKGRNYEDLRWSRVKNFSPAEMF
jgi:type I restriction enzyme M protein